MGLNDVTCSICGKKINYMRDEYQYYNNKYYCADCWGRMVAERKNEKEERTALEERIYNEHKAEALSRMGGIFEYKTVTVSEDNSGLTPSKKLDDALNKMAADGWVLKTAYSSEIGINSHVEVDYFGEQDHAKMLRFVSM